MSVYSVDYNARTREMKSAREQRAREIAVTAASQQVSGDGTGFHNHSSDQRAKTVLNIAKRLEKYILTGEIQ